MPFFSLLMQHPTSWITAICFGLLLLLGCKTPQEPGGSSPFASLDRSIIEPPPTGSYLAQQPSYTPPVVPTPYPGAAAPSVTPYPAGDSSTPIPPSSPPNIVPYASLPTTPVSQVSEQPPVLLGQSKPIPLTFRPTTLFQTTQQEIVPGGLSSSAMQVTEIQ